MKNFTARRPQTYFNLLAWLLIAFVFVKCNNDNDDQVNILKSDLTFEQAKNALFVAKDSSDLATKISAREKSYTVLFESGDSLVIAKEYITTIDEKPGEWSTLITFKDGSVIHLPSLGELAFGNEVITVNPYERNPLAAVAEIDMPVKGRFKIVVHKKSENGVSMEKTFSVYANHHQVPILGLYENYKNQVELIFLDKNGKTRASKMLDVQTESLPEHPVMTIVTNQLPITDAGIFFNAGKPVGFDQKGEIRWYFKSYGDFLYLFPKLRNGNLIVVGSKDIFSYYATHFFEITPLGQIVREYKVPNGMHHEIIEMPNGNFVAASNSHPVVLLDGVPEEDIVIEIDRNTGGVIKTWDFNLILDPTRKPLPDSRMDDWLHINAVWYDEEDNALIVSGRSQSTIIKIDHDTDQIKWILADHHLWNETLQQYLLTPVDANGVEINTAATEFWPYGQHSPRLKPNGNLLVYDNGDFRGYYDNNAVPGDSYTRILEFKIDEANKKIQIVNQFDNNKQVFTKFTGTVNFQEQTSSIFIGYMYLPSYSKIVEIDANNAILFEATFTGDMGNYRGLKLDLYESLSY
jgi:arylsulfate sulfotransferase